MQVREKPETLVVWRKQGIWLISSLESKLLGIASSSTPTKNLFIIAEAIESMGMDKIESNGALSQVPQGVLIKGDLSSYIDCKIEDLGSLEIYS